MMEIVPGTLPQWGTFAALIAAILGGITAYIKGSPDRTKANSDAKQADNADYSAQIKGFREEVNGYRSEVQVLRERLTQSESASRLRADRITNMTFIIRLLISELLRLDPNSIIVQQAEFLLRQMDRNEPGSTAPAPTPTENADRAVEKAQDTVVAAKATVAELIQDRDEL